MDSIDIKFGEYSPDLGMHDNPGVVEATNVYPHPMGFVPADVYGDATYSALSNDCRGGISTEYGGTAGNYVGDNSKLYRLNGATWTDSSKGGGYTLSINARWKFAQFGSMIIAVDGWDGDSPQYITLGGTTFADLTTTLKASCAAQVRDFVMLGNTYDATDGHIANQVWWSALGDPTSFPTDAATKAAVQSDKQQIRAMGEVRAIVGGEYAIIMGDRCITRATYEGPPTLFRFDDIAPRLGILGPGAAARYQNLIFAWTTQGFCVIENGQTITPIGQNKVDKTAFNTVNAGYLHLIECAVDQRNKRVFWTVPKTAGATDLLCYDFGIGRWSAPDPADDITYMFAFSASGASQSINLGLWKSADKKLYVPSGTYLTGTITTGFFEPYAKSGKLAYWDGLEPLVESDTANSTLSLSAKYKINRADEATTTLAVGNTVDANGRFNFRAMGRFIQPSLSTNGNGIDYIKGLRMYCKPAGHR